MRTVIFAVTARGAKAAEKIADRLSNGNICKNPDLMVYIKQKSDTLVQSRCVTFFDGDEMAGCVREEFDRCDALIFVCAAGIAVRMIAPCLEHKSKDPAVLVFDEGMNYCIPILSGHLGGANELARSLSDELGTVPVITTASDLAGLTAADMFAKSHDLVITDYDKAKVLTAALLDGESIGVINEAEDAFTLKAEDLPGGYMPAKDQEKIIRITYKKEEAGSGAGMPEDSIILDLVPRCLGLGIGCRKGTCEDKIRKAVDRCLERHGIYREAVAGVGSIDLKADEEGLLDYCSDEGLPCTFYSAEKLKSVEGDFAGSDFVNEVTGVDNVCERSAMAEGKRLIVNKEIYDGVTIAIAIRR